MLHIRKAICLESCKHSAHEMHYFMAGDGAQRESSAAEAISLSPELRLRSARAVWAIQFLRCPPAPKHDDLELCWLAQVG